MTARAITPGALIFPSFVPKYLSNTCPIPVQYSAQIKSNWMLWVPFQFVNFRFVPPHLQVEWGLLLAALCCCLRFVAVCVTFAVCASCLHCALGYSAVVQAPPCAASPPSESGKPCCHCCPFGESAHVLTAAAAAGANVALLLPHCLRCSRKAGQSPD